MKTEGYVFIGVFLVGPLLGAVAATVRGRTHPAWLTPLWGAVIGTGILMLTMATGRNNLPQQERLALAMMACAVAAWVVLVPALAFPVRAGASRPVRGRAPPGSEGPTVDRYPLHPPPDDSADHEPRRPRCGDPPGSCYYQWSDGSCHCELGG